MKDQNYYVSQCSAQNQTRKEVTNYGYITEHEIEGKKVVLTFNQYSDEGGDIDDELIDVKIYD